MTSRPERSDASPIASETRARPRSAAVVMAATVLAGAGLVANFGGWHSDKARAVEASLASSEAKLAKANDEAARAERKLAELERKRTDAETAITEGNRRIAMLDERRGMLQRQVEELAGPVKPGAEERSDDTLAPPPATKRSSASVDEDASRQASLAGSPEDEESPPDALAENEAGDTPAPVQKASTASVDAAASVPAGPVRVFIHIQSADPDARNRARALAADLRRRGVEVAQIRGVRLPIRQNLVRYFHDADRDAVSALQAAISETSGSSARAQDFRGFGSAPRQGTLEIWMS